MRPRRTTVVAAFTALTLLVGGCTSTSNAVLDVPTGADLAAVQDAARSQQTAADQAAAAQEAAERAAAARTAAVKRAAEQAQLAKVTAAKAAQLKAAQLKAAKAKAAQLKAAKAKAAQLKAAKAKAAQLKVAAAKAAQLKAAKAKAAKLKAAKRKAAAARAAALRFDPLTGNLRSSNPVIAVKIDNTSAGRPQFGLAAADVVYVEQVEGGLTRLIAIFHSELPTEVGPVRSVRSTDVELLPSYGRPLIAFSGGAGGPLALLASSRLVDASGTGGYFRSSAKRAPYNLHANLQQVAAGKPGQGQAGSPGFVFATAYPQLAKAAGAAEITVRMNAGTTGFRWDPSTGNYRVIAGGNPASDAAGRPIKTDNVLVQRVTDTPDGTVDTNGQPSLLSQTVGRGDFTLFRDGKQISGRWSRPQQDRPTRFLDAGGVPIKFDRGRTWITLAPQDAQVTAS